MAGSVAPSSAGWLFPKPIRLQLAEAPGRATVALVVCCLATLALVVAVVLGEGRSAAYVVVGLIAASIAGCVVLLVAWGLMRHRRRGRVVGDT